MTDTDIVPSILYADNAMAQAIVLLERDKYANDHDARLVKTLLKQARCQIEQWIPKEECA